MSNINLLEIHVVMILGNIHQREKAPSDDDGGHTNTVPE
jgi:hypothetical protein